MKKEFNLLMVCVLALSVGCGGTNTGNPPSAASPTNGGLVTTAAQAVLTAACTKLAACFAGLTVDQCNAGVLPQTNLAAALGLAPGFGTYQAIINAESAGTIHPIVGNESTCLSDINALACGAAAVQTAYSSGAPSDFTKVVNLIPTGASSCKGLY